MPRHQFFLLLSSAVLLSAAALSACGKSEDNAVYFRVSDGDPKDTFVIRLTDPNKIATARAIVAGTKKGPVHVAGVVIAEAESYNKPWHFHLDSPSIVFFEMSVEVCDTKTSYVEDHLKEVGGAFLPKYYWCPWGSKIEAEIPAP